MDAEAQWTRHITMVENAIRAMLVWCNVKEARGAPWGPTPFYNPPPRRRGCLSSGDEEQAEQERPKNEVERKGKTTA